MSGHHRRCSVHPSARAGWFCQGCEQRLCPECVGTRQLANGRAELARDPYGPFAPRAMFTMGRVLQDRLDSPEKARGVFESLIKHFPQDDFSQRAQDELRRRSTT